MNHCDTCLKLLPSDDRNYIEIWFHGKFGDIAKLIAKDRVFHFCSMTCLSKFDLSQFPLTVTEAKRRNKKI